MNDRDKLKNIYYELLGEEATDEEFDEIIGEEAENNFSFLKLFEYVVENKTFTMELTEFHIIEKGFRKIWNSSTGELIGDGQFKNFIYRYIEKEIDNKTILEPIPQKNVDECVDLILNYMRLIGEYNLNTNSEIMKKVKHRFLGRKINKNTETLILGTFNPETIENQASFFYSRSRNYLWRILPSAYNENDLKGANKSQKETFITKYNIDFIDLIEEVKVDDGEEANYSDAYIDDKVIKWRKVVDAIKNLPNLKRVCFTRKTYTSIPNIKEKVEFIQKYCNENGINFKLLVTPSRFYREDKQNEWTNFLLDK